MTQSRVSRNKRRNQKGQALVEGTVATILLVAVFLGILVLGLNIFFALTYSSKIQTVAMEAAKVAAADKYWLGMERPDYNAGASAQNVRGIADHLAAKLGLPPIRSLRVRESRTGSADIMSVSLTVSGLRLPFGGGVFPSLLTLSGQGVSVQPRQTVYAAIDISAPLHKNSKQRHTVRLPAYGFFKDPNPNVGAYDKRTAVNLPNNAGRIGRMLGPKYFRGLPLEAPNRFAAYLFNDGKIEFVDTH